MNCQKGNDHIGIAIGICKKPYTKFEDLITNYPQDQKYIESLNIHYTYINFDQMRDSIKQDQAKNNIKLSPKLQTALDKFDQLPDSDGLLTYKDCLLLQTGFQQIYPNPNQIPEMVRNFTTAINNSIQKQACLFWQ